MRLLPSIILLTLAVSVKSEWSWNKETNEPEPNSELLEGEQLAEETEVKPIEQTSNGTVLDDIVDEIISSKQGRSLNKEFDQFYSDPTIKEALETDDSIQSRNMIKERLCSLGLMQCDGDEMEKRRYVSPDELIYAQPVDIKPIGRPIASIPIRGPPKAYGYGKPQSPYPPRPQKLPPRKVGYNPTPPKATYIADKYGSSGNYYNGNGEVIYGPKPYGERPYSERPYQFEAAKPIYGKPQSIAIPISESATGIKSDAVQQHIHHHYVHSDSDKDPKVIVKPVDSFDNGFKPSNVYGSDIKPAYENNNDFTLGSSYNTLGNDFYKKELNLAAPAPVNNLGPQLYPEAFDYQNGRGDGLDCICVNYDQCPSQEVIGKRDDLILPIDPRNKGDVAALTEEQLNNVTQSEFSSDNVTSTTETSARRKREVKEEKAEDKVDDQKPIESRSFSSFAGYGGGVKKAVEPTFGISFGLPNHIGSNPSPFLNTNNQPISGTGLNLGLFSINPLVSLQVTKTEIGEKHVKPFINFHITPNEHVIHRLNHILEIKKNRLLETSSDHQTPTYYTYKPPKIYYGYQNSQDYHEDDSNDYYQNTFDNSLYLRSNDRKDYAKQYNTYSRVDHYNPVATRGGTSIKFPSNRRRRSISNTTKGIGESVIVTKRQYYGSTNYIQQQCRPNQVCCKRPLKPGVNRGQCGIKHSQGIIGRIKTPSHVDSESEFGEYPWQVAILEKDIKEPIYVCGGTLIDNLHIITAAHCVKQYKGYNLKVRLGEWDVNHDVEFFPYIERDIVSVHVHPQYYAGTLDNDLAILKMEQPVDWTQYPHISPACLPDKYTDYSGQRCWTTGWGKDAFGDYGKYQNILKEVDIPVLQHNQCENQLRRTRLGYNYQLNPGFICAGGEEGKDACKGDGGGPMVCERGGTWQLVGVVSWGIGCGQPNVPGVYVKVSHYLDWISQVTGRFSNYS